DRSRRSSKFFFSRSRNLRLESDDMALAIAIFLTLLQSDLRTDPRSALPDALRITVIDGGKFRPYAVTQFNAGPAVGDGLNGHFFPSVIAYNQGRYNYALQDFSYVIRNAY